MRPVESRQHRQIQEASCFALQVRTSPDFTPAVLRDDFVERTREVIGGGNGLVYIFGTQHSPAYCEALIECLFIHKYSFNFRNVLGSASGLYINDGSVVSSQHVNLKAGPLKFRSPKRPSESAGQRDREAYPRGDFHCGSTECESFCPILRFPETTHCLKPELLHRTLSTAVSTTFPPTFNTNRDALF